MENKENLTLVREILANWRSISTKINKHISDLIAIEKGLLLNTRIKSSKQTEIPNIIEVVSWYYGIKPSLLKTGKDKKVVHARHMAMYIGSRFHSLTLLGKMFEMDHTSIIYGRNKISDNFYDFKT